MLTFQNGVMVNLKKGLQFNSFNSSKEICYMSLDMSQDINYLATGKKVVLALSNPLNLDIF